MRKPCTPRRPKTKLWRIRVVVLAPFTGEDRAVEAYAVVRAADPLRAFRLFDRLAQDCDARGTLGPHRHVEPFAGRPNVAERPCRTVLRLVLGRAM